MGCGPSLRAAYCDVESGAQLSAVGVRAMIRATIFLGFLTFCWASNTVDEWCKRWQG